MTLHKDMLNMLKRGMAMDSFIFLISCGTLFGPVPLPVSIVNDNQFRLMMLVSTLMNFHLDF